MDDSDDEHECWDAADTFHVRQDARWENLHSNGGLLTEKDPNGHQSEANEKAENGATHGVLAEHVPDAKAEAGESGEADKPSDRRFHYVSPE